jgi:hypothetical protein
MTTATTTPAEAAAAALEIEREAEEAVGLRGAAEAPIRGWFTRLVTRYMTRELTVLRGTPFPTDINIPGAARGAIRKAALISAAGGALTGSISTAATILTAETEGMAGFVALPFAAAAIGVEMAWRSVVHVRLTCKLAHLFGVRFDAEDTDDVLRLYALAFGTHSEKKEDEADFGRGLLEKVTDEEGEDVGERVGQAIVGESVMRNIVPVLGIFTSAITNFVVTQRLGDTVRRYMRYQRAIEDAVHHAELTCERSKLLLIEGMWFIFTADGVLAPEEAGCLAHMLSDLSEEDRSALRARFTDDEIDWMGRVKVEVPEDMRDAFYYALQVAACLDKEVSLPERKILKRIALMFKKTFDPAQLQKMIDELEEKGILAPPEC